MKETICAAIAVFLLMSGYAFAEGQWATSGNNIYNTNSGNVGIGITSPGDSLHLHSEAGLGSTSMQITADDNADAYVYFLSDYDGTSRIGQVGIDYSSNSLKLVRGGIGSSDGISIDPSGNVGIGTPNPDGNLHVMVSDASLPSHAWSSLTVEKNDNVAIQLLSGSNKYSAIFMAGLNGVDEAGIRYHYTNRTMDILASNDVRIHLANGGNVGIGTTEPLGMLHINGSVKAGNGIISGHDPGASTFSFIADSTPSNTSEFGTFNIYSSSAPLQDKGGMIALGGKFRETGNPYASFAKILGGKENAAEQYAGYLAFYTRAHGAAHVEKMRITSDGKVGIGITSPGDLLHLHSEAGLGSTSMQITADDNADAYVYFLTDYDGTSRIGQVGIDYSSNSLKLVRGGIGSSDGISIDPSGNVGIGTPNPDGNLHVMVSDASLPSHAWSALTLEKNDHVALQFLVPPGKTSAIWFPGTGGVDEAGIKYGYSTRTMTINCANEPAITIDSSRRVGIGTASPDNKLDVKGTIRAEEVIVETGWSDFVFDDKYELPSLESVESYIQNNKHLPDIPSAKEIKEEGLSVSEMLAKQMQKIEELTLYLIELKKKKGQSEILKSITAGFSWVFINCSCHHMQPQHLIDGRVRMRTTPPWLSFSIRSIAM